MSFHEKLEQFILKGLIDEWHLITDIYNIDKQGGFVCPVFSFTDSESFLGKWEFNKYQISIQRKFAVEQPWENIRFVLKHEMAHQYADTVLKSSGETPHGKSFKKACKILRIPEKSVYDFCGEKNETVEKRSLISKVKKLFSLAGSDNFNEAENAMKKAHELMIRHNFETFDLESNNYSSKCLGKPALKHFRESYYLSSMLARFYFVYPVWVPFFVKEKGKTGKVLEISGELRNIEIASYVYDFVNFYIDKSWKDFNKNRNLTRYKKTDFAIGIIEGFSSKIQNSHNYKKNKNNLPVAAENDPKLNKYLEWYYPVLRKQSKKGGVSKDLYDHGVKKGKEMVISKGVTEKSSFSGGLLN